MPRSARGYRLRELPGGAWQVRFSHAGHRYEISTEELDIDRAEAKARQIYAAVISGRWVPGSQLAAPGAPVWQVAAGWLDAIESMVAKSTRKQYGIYVTAHWQPHFKEMDAFARPQMVPGYIRARLKVVRRRSLQKELSALRGFLAWCHEVGHLPDAVIIPKLTVKSPGKPDERRRHKSVPIELTVADVHAILDNLPEWSKGGPTGKPFPVRDFYRTVYETGLRPDATVAELVPEDLRAGELAVRDEVDKARFGRSVPLTPLARECLERHATTPGKPIFGRRHRAVYLKAAALLAGKPGVSAYDFRHARATHLMEASGNNILGVGYLLGHTQATTTNRYARQTHRAAEAVLSETLVAANHSHEPAPTPLQAQPQPGRGSSRGPDTTKPGTGDSRERPALLPAQTSGVAPGSSGPVGDANGALCWRCGGEPFKHERLVTRRPVCASCAWELIQSSLRDDPPEGNVLGTIGNAEVRKEGVEPSREVIPQEPERSRSAISSEDLRDRPPYEDGTERQLATPTWESGIGRIWPAVGVTQAEIDADLAARPRRSA